jgi:hypothetical protein
LLGLGPLIQGERPALGVVTRLLGLAALLDAVGRFLNVETLFIVGIGGLFVLFPVWLLWWGIDLLRKPASATEFGKG